jgi:RHS repeat-associated protein
MTTKTRKTYQGKERDKESYLGDFGARLACFLCKYDYAAGNRFTSPDVLWEKYMGWSQYQYCGNNPISGKDDDGIRPINQKDRSN